MANAQITLTVDGRTHHLAVRPDSSDLAVVKQIFERRDYDTNRLAHGADLRARYQAMVEAGETPLILDLGANIGASALWFHLMWAKARVVAVEPAADNFALLSENCAPYGAIMPVQAAAASADGFARILDAGAEAWAYRTETGEGGDIAARSIPSMLADAGAARPFICKIDIEGAEAELFSDGAPWMEAFDLVIVELHDWLFPGRGTSRNFLKAHTALDRDLVPGGENLFSLANRR